MNGIKGRAHPRSRGENVSLLPPATAFRGSSPLTRGKRNDRARKGARGGLIPAHAGKTHLRLRGVRHTPAHPRSRGENGNGPTAGNPMYGSSPLTRGKPRRDRRDPDPRRLIPAHAGKTRMVGKEAQCRGAHPRSRGENKDRPQTT